MKKRTIRVVTAGLVLTAMSLLCTGCIGYSEVTYEKGKMNIVSEYYEGSAELMAPMYTGEYEKSSEKSELYQTKSTYETGKLQELVMTQEFLEVDSLTFDGKDYLVTSATKIMNSDGKTVGKLTADQTVKVLYFVEGLAIIPLEDDFGYVSRTSLSNMDGTPLPVQGDITRPYVSVQKQVGEMILGNQHGIRLAGEAIPVITVKDSVVALVVLNVDFDTLTVEGNARVQLENCTGGTVIAAPGAEVTLGENATVKVMTTMQTGEGE